jgi:oxygen-dependent protoporphyrinogen oxidase
MLGGSVNPEIVAKDPSDIAQIALEELSEIMGIKSKPEYEKVIVWKNAIPQYTLGHLQRFNRIENRLAEIGSIYLTGNAYTGIGLNDCIKRSHTVVKKLVSESKV